MTMHRQHPDLSFGVSVDHDEAGLPAASLSHPRSIDVAVCEWTADLAAGSVLGTAGPRTTVSAVGFVDFDVVESVRQR